MTLPSPVLGTALMLGRALLFNAAPWVTQGAGGLSNKPVDVVPCASRSNTPVSYTPSLLYRRARAGPIKTGAAMASNRQ